MASDAIADIKTTFFQECEEQLAELEAGLLALEGGEADLETVNAIFRAVHSIKGGAGAFHLNDLVRFAHAYETTLDHLRSGQISATPAGTKVMLRAADMLADLVRAARDGGAADIARGDGIIEELVALSGAAEESAADDDGDGMDGLDFTPVQVSFGADSMNEATAAADDAPSSARYIVEFMPKPALYAKANEAGLLLRELARLGEAVVSCDISGTPLLPDLDPEGAYLRWTVTLPGDVDEAAIREVFEFVADDCDLEIRREGGASPAPALAVEPQNPDILNLLKTLEAEVQAQQAAA
ncbi:MAG TPA: Hpt domain-containing protein, partial [Roseiarcus sp.]|nr:Hpt domain-containing protein [Roseiarcus sp.]